MPADSFRDAFYTYMASPDEKIKVIKDLLDSLKFAELVQCFDVYFVDSQSYGDEDGRSLDVFTQLTLTAIQKSPTPYFALGIASKLEKSGNVWNARYGKLPKASKRAIDQAIARKKESLKSEVKTFLEKYDTLMTQKDSRQKGAQSQKTIAEWLSPFAQKKNTGVLQGCLSAYLAVTEGYAKGGNSDSLLVFYGLSRLTINASGAVFAAQYEVDSKTGSGTLKKRYDALDESFRSAIDGDISDQKKLRHDVTYKGKTIPVTVGSYSGKPAVSDRALPGDDVVATLTKAQREFKPILLAILSKKKPVDDLFAFVRKHSFQELRECMNYYLTASDKTPSGEYDISLDVFYGLLSLTLAQGDAYYALKVLSLTSTAGSVWKKRFDALKPERKNALIEQIKGKIAQGRIIDSLKFQYFAQHHTDASPEKLRDFVPPCSPGDIELLDLCLGGIEPAVNVRSTESFNANFDKLADLLSNQFDTLNLVAMMMRCRARRSLRSEIRHLVYLYIFGVCFVRILNNWPEAYAHGLNDDERSYFIGKEEKGDPYFNDFVIQFEHVIRNRLGAPSIAEICKAQAGLHLYAWRRSLELAPMRDGLIVADLYETVSEKLPDIFNAISIPVASQFGSGAKVPLGQTFDDLFVIWWDPKRDRAYVRLKDTEKIVFQLKAYETLGSIRDGDAVYGEVARNTQGTLIMIPILFEILGRIPDLVTGGVTGLVENIIFDRLIDASVQALGIDPRIVQVAMLGVTVVGAYHASRSTGASGVEHDLTPGERAIAHSTGESQHIADRAIDQSLTSAESRGLHEGMHPSGTDPTDIRGITRDDGIVEIRGEPAATTNITPAETSAARLNDRELVTESTGIGSTDVPSVGSSKKPSLQEVQGRITEHEASIVHHEKDLKQTEESLGKQEDRYEELSEKDTRRPREEDEFKRLEKSRPELQRRIDETEAKLWGARQKLTEAQVEIRQLRDHSVGEFNLPSKPTTRRVGSVEVTSWRKDCWIGAGDTGKARVDLEKALNEVSNSDLAKALLKDKELLPASGEGFTREYLEARPQIVDMAHVRTGQEGHPDVLVISTAARNRRHGVDLEMTGEVLTDLIVNIDGFAITQEAAEALVRANKLPQSALDRAIPLDLLK